MFSVVQSGLEEELNIATLCKSDEHLLPKVWKAIGSGNDAELKQLLSVCKNKTQVLDYCSENSNLTSAMLACVSESVECLKLMVRYVNLNLVNDSGDSACHFAVSSIKCLRLVANETTKTVDINKQNEDGNTPVHLALQLRNFECVRHLILKCSTLANLEIKNKEGKTPIEMIDETDEEMQGIIQECLMLLPSILKARADEAEEIAAVITARETLWSFIELGDAFEAQKVIVGVKDKNLLLNTAYFDKESDEMFTAAMYAAKLDKVQILQVIADADADFSIQNASNGETVLHIVSKSFDALQVITNQKYKIAGKNGPLSSNFRSVDLNVKNNRGETALHLASKACARECISLLIGLGADTEVKDIGGKTPMVLIQEGDDGEGGDKEKEARNVFEASLKLFHEHRDENFRHHHHHRHHRHFHHDQHLHHKGSIINLLEGIDSKKYNACFQLSCTGELLIFKADTEDLEPYDSTEVDVKLGVDEDVLKHEFDVLTNLNIHSPGLFIIPLALLPCEQVKSVLGIPLIQDDQAVDAAAEDDDGKKIGSIPITFAMALALERKSQEGFSLVVEQEKDEQLKNRLSNRIVEIVGAAHQNDICLCVLNWKSFCIVTEKRIGGQIKRNMKLGRNLEYSLLSNMELPTADVASWLLRERENAKYLAPELAPANLQFEQDANTFSDIWSVGVMLYELYAKTSLWVYLGVSEATEENGNEENVESILMALADPDLQDKVHDAIDEKISTSSTNKMLKGMLTVRMHDRMRAAEIKF